MFGCSLFCACWGRYCNCFYSRHCGKNFKSDLWLATLSWTFNGSWTFLDSIVKKPSTLDILATLDTLELCGVKPIKSGGAAFANRKCKAQKSILTQLPTRHYQSWLAEFEPCHTHTYIHTYHAINLSPQHSIQRRKLQSGKRPLSHMSGNTLKTQQEQNATWKNETMPNLALCSICAELIKQTYPWHNFNPFAQHKRLYAASSCDALRCSFITAHRPRHVKTSCSDVKTHCFSVCCLRV